MDVLKFKNDEELEIISAVKSEVELEVHTKVNEDMSVNDIIELFSDPSKTEVIKQYFNGEIIGGFAGYTKLQSITYQPNMVMKIDYEQSDPTTNSGFVEEKENIVIVIMHKESAIDAIAQQTNKNTANINYIAKESGIDL